MYKDIFNKILLKKFIAKNFFEKYTINFLSFKDSNLLNLYFDLNFKSYLYKIITKLIVKLIVSRLKTILKLIKEK